jgi:cold shock CspA family protein/arsenate reductase-like glutaredoxin family protein
MPNGTVKFFNAAKGFGFITPDEHGKEVFLPATSVTSSGISGLAPGQRVSFETRPDTKGPKAVDLKIIAPVHTPKPPDRSPAPPARGEEARKLTVYIDPDSAAAGEVLAELRRAGNEPDVVDYIASPPAKEELKQLSLLLRESNQSLVRKYEPLFLELHLDDRFIGDSEFWGAIFEHPSLINGPVVATTTRASVCHSKAAAKSFLSALASGEPQPAPRRKGLPPSLLRLVSGGAATPPAVKEAAVEKPLPKSTVPPAKKAPGGLKSKAVAKPKPKSAAKAKPSPKTTVRKPAKKSGRKTKT